MKKYLIIPIFFLPIIVQANWAPFIYNWYEDSYIEFGPSLGDLEQFRFENDGTDDVTIEGVEIKVCRESALTTQEFDLIVYNDDVEIYRKEFNDHEDFSICNDYTTITEFFETTVAPGDYLKVRVELQESGTYEYRLLHTTYNLHSNVETCSYTTSCAWVSQEPYFSLFGTGYQYNTTDQIDSYINPYKPAEWNNDLIATTTDQDIQFTYNNENGYYDRLVFKLGNKLGVDLGGVYSNIQYESINTGLGTTSVLHTLYGTSTETQYTYTVYLENTETGYKKQYWGHIGWGVNWGITESDWEQAMANHQEAREAFFANTCGTFDVLCNIQRALVWAFIPDSDVMGEVGEMVNSILHRSPWGYITLTIERIVTLGERADNDEFNGTDDVYLDFSTAPMNGKEDYFNYTGTIKIWDYGAPYELIGNDKWLYFNSVLQSILWILAIAGLIRFAFKFATKHDS